MGVGAYDDNSAGTDSGIVKTYILPTALTSGTVFYNTDGILRISPRGLGKLLIVKMKKMKRQPPPPPPPPAGTTAVNLPVIPNFDIPTVTAPDIPDVNNIPNVGITPEIPQINIPNLDNIVIDIPVIILPDFSQLLGGLNLP